MENWKPIKSYESYYEVSDLGRVKSLGNNKSNNSIQRILKLGDRRGYRSVGLYKDGKYKEYSVHRLVAQAFIGLDISDIKQVVCHRNDIPDDNRAENLFVGTHKDNTKDMILKGRTNPFYKGKLGKKHNSSREIYQYSLKGKFIKKWYGGYEIQRELGFTPSNINRVCNLKRRTAHGFFWSYTEQEEKDLLELLLMLK